MLIDTYVHNRRACVEKHLQHRFIHRRGRLTNIITRGLNVYLIQPLLCSVEFTFLVFAGVYIFHLVNDLLVGWGKK